MSTTARSSGSFDLFRPFAWLAATAFAIGFTVTLAAAIGHQMARQGPPQVAGAVALPAASTTPAAPEKPKAI